MNQQWQDSITALRVCLAANKPLVLKSRPGEGKSSLLESLGAAEGMYVRTLIASNYQPADFVGIPWVDPRTRAVQLIPSAWVRDVLAQSVAPDGEGERKVVVLIDEVSTAVPATQAALLRPVLERVAGDTPLPKETRFVLAMNPADIAADGWDLAAPLANRLVHLDWEIPYDVVADGIANGFEPLTFPTVDPLRVAAEVTRTRSYVAGFLRHMPDLKSVLPASEGERGDAWPSPRSWETAAVLHGHALAMDAGQSGTNKVVAGAVGPAAAISYLSWVATLDLPDPEVLLAAPETFVCPRRMDHAYTIGQSVLAAFRAAPTPERWYAVGQILTAIAEAGFKDMAVIPARTWASKAYVPKGAILPPATVKHFAEMMVLMDLQAK
ncbi:MAG: AAA family ATPase [Motilibacteraceae bacterium]